MKVLSFRMNGSLLTMKTEKNGVITVIKTAASSYVKEDLSNLVEVAVRDAKENGWTVETSERKL